MENRRRPRSGDAKVVSFKTSDHGSSGSGYTINQYGEYVRTTTSRKNSYSPRRSGNGQSERKATKPEAVAVTEKDLKRAEARLSRAEGELDLHYVNMASIKADIAIFQAEYNVWTMHGGAGAAFTSSRAEAETLLLDAKFELDRLNSLTKRINQAYSKANSELDLLRAKRSNK